MLQKNNYYSPFMGECKPMSVGLNPLGMRTASEQLFSMLLPGLNVVTLRIRYYSFYCWLLDRFYTERKEKHKDATLDDFRRHIRMSELLMALIHAQSAYNEGVPGITRAKEIISRSDEDIDFKEDAMPQGKPSGGYWKGSFGALGTYYIASLREMGLISSLNDNPRLINCTSNNNGHITGKDLSDAFSKTIGTNGYLFEKCVQNGKVTLSELEELEPSFQTHCLLDNDETNLLIKMLLQNDSPLLNLESTLRRDTLKLLLNYFIDCGGAKFSELDFAQYVYNRYRNIDNNLSVIGWYAYYLNDCRQYEALNIFDEVLKRLRDSSKNGQWENIDEFTTRLADDVLANLKCENKSVRVTLNDWNALEKPSEPMARAFYVILDIYKQNHDYKHCKEIVRKLFHNVSNDSFDAFDMLEKHIEEPIHTYFKNYLTENIIYNHYSESMRKYSQNGILTQKLTIENGYVKWLGSYEASHSSPRVDTLRNFVEDLGLVNDGKVTEKGFSLLTDLENDR